VQLAGDHGVGAHARALAVRACAAWLDEKP
jgi:hypothetical protein